jgi:stage II sporulation protein D
VKRLVLALALVVVACRPSVRPSVRPSTPLRGEPWVRVGIVVDRDSASLSATSQFRVLNADGSIIAVVDSGRTWSVAPGDAGQLRLTRPDRPAPVSVGGGVIVRPDRAGGAVIIAGRRYRGEARVLRGSSGVTVVNVVPMESYLLSVVALELGFRDPRDRQAVMAQAVAARTYAMRFRGRREALGFDVYATDADQVYTGLEPESEEVADAVRRTAGEILTYRGEPIQALFHSTCGWSTETAAQVFQNNADTPYLRAVSDRFGRGNRDYYCATSPRFRWREEWDAAALSAVVAQTLPAVAGSRAATFGRVTDIRATRVTPTGRVVELTITTTDGSFVVPQGRVREVLRSASGAQLSSSMLQLHLERQGGELVRVVAAGAGYGHGVGMCQFGAVGRARHGQSYRSILATYYHDTALERMY